MRTSLGLTRTTRWTDATGTASTSPPALTRKASAIAMVSGSLMVKRVPAPTSVSTSMSPPSRVTLVRTTSMPTPRPAAVVTLCAVLKPGRKIRSGGARGLADLSGDAGEQARDRHHPGTSDLATEVAGEALDPAGVVADTAHDGGELALDLRDVARDLADTPGQDVEIVVAIELERPEALEVGQRSAGGQGECPRLAALRHARIEVLLFEVAHDVAHARLAEDEQLVHPLELAQPALEPAAGDHQLADQVHQRVEPVEVHPDARGRSTRRRRRRSRLGLVLIDGRRFFDR